MASKGTCSSCACDSLLPIFFVSKIFGLLPFSIRTKNDRKELVYSILLSFYSICFQLAVVVSYLFIWEALSEIENVVNNPTERFMQQGEIIISSLGSFIFFVHLFKLRPFSNLFNTIQEVDRNLGFRYSEHKSIFFKSLLLIGLLLLVIILKFLSQLSSDGIFCCLPYYIVFLNVFKFIIISSQFSLLCLLIKQRITFLNQKLSQTLQSHNFLYCTQRTPALSSSKQNTKVKTVQETSKASKMFLLRECFKLLYNVSDQIVSMYQLQIVVLFIVCFFGIVAKIFLFMFGFYDQKYFKGYNYFFLASQVILQYTIPFLLTLISSDGLAGEVRFLFILWFFISSHFHTCHRIYRLNKNIIAVAPYIYL